MSHRFPVIAHYWSNFALDRGVPLFNALVRNEPRNSRYPSQCIRKQQTVSFGSLEIFRFYVTT